MTHLGEPSDLISLIQNIVGLDRYILYGILLCAYDEQDKTLTLGEREIAYLMTLTADPKKLGTLAAMLKAAPMSGKSRNQILTLIKPFVDPSDNTMITTAVDDEVELDEGLSGLSGLSGELGGVPEIEVCVNSDDSDDDSVDDDDLKSVPQKIEEYSRSLVDSVVNNPEPFDDKVLAATTQSAVIDARVDQLLKKTGGHESEDIGRDIASAQILQRFSDVTTPEGMRTALTVVQEA